MQRASGKSKLNVRHISLGHGDSDPYIEGEQHSYTKSKSRIAKVVNLTSQPVAPIIRYQQQQRNERDTEQRKALDKIIKMFEYTAMIFGIELNHEWKPTTNIRYIFTLFLLAFSWVCILYTQAMHISNGDNVRVLEPFSIYGITISLFAIGVMICVGFFLACPLKAYIVDKELLSLLPTEIIFIDQSTYSGFMVANLIMIVMGTYAAFGLVVYGSVFIFAIFMYSLKVDLIEQDLKDLDAMWANEIIVSRAYKHAYLRNICQKRQDLNDFMCEIKEIFETKLFYYFVSNYFSQIICLFEVTKNQWTPGYAIALASFIEMMFYCYMGTKITIADEKYFSSICATNWYTYDLYSQKMIILLLHQSETPNNLQLGPIGPLNVITGITVVKSIYSYYTVMTEVL